MTLRVEASAPTNERRWAAIAERSPLLHAAYSLMLNTGLTAVLGVLFWIAAARLYDARDVGRATAVISAMLFVSGISQLNMISFLGRYLPVLDERRARALRLSYGVTCTLTLLVAIGYVAYDDRVGAGALQTSRFLAPLFVVAAVGWTVFSLQDAALTALRGAHWVPVENAIFGVVKLALLVVFAAAGGAMGVFAPWVIGALASLIPINVLIFRRLIHTASSARPETLALPEAARFAGPDYVASLFNYASAALVPALMLQWVGSKETGYFALAWTSALTIDLLALNMATALTVEGARDRDRLPDLLRSALRHTFAVMVPLSIAAVVIAPFALEVYGPGYARAGAWVIRLMGLACIPRALNNVAVGVLRVTGRTKWVAVINGVVCIFTIGTGALLVHHIGVCAPALGWLVGQSIVSLFTTRFMVRRILRQDTLGKEPDHVARG